MDQAIAVLRAEHLWLQELLDEFAQDAGSSSANLYRRRLRADALLAGFAEHLDLERAYLHPVLAELPADRREAGARDAAEGEAARESMQVLADTDPQDSRFAEAAAQLRRQVIRHLARQEEELFPLLPGAGPETLEALGVQLRRVRPART